MNSSITRRTFYRLMLAVGAESLVAPRLSPAVPAEAPFIHPGLLHSATDLERMRDAVLIGRQPISAGFDKLCNHPLSSISYTHYRFSEEIGRNPNVNFGEFDSDANAAYQCALMAAITGDRRYAGVSRTIVLGWSKSLQLVSGADAVLMAGLGPFKLINAAEILRYLGQLDGRGSACCIAMLRRVILPAIVDFAPFANGNWDAAAVKTMLAIAVFCDDQPLFERALLYYLQGDGDGCLTHYVYDNGQCQESGRDQQHTQLGLGHLGDACQIAWNQGWDLYGAVDNRLLRGFEYTATYNLGGEVDFRPEVDCTGNYRHNAISPPSRLRPIYEQILAHYQVLRGIPVPAVLQAIEKIRPEGAGPGADQTGFGTLLYARSADDHDPTPRRVPPTALRSSFRGNAIEVEWLRARAKESAKLERDDARLRADEQSGSLRDRHVAPGRIYKYCFSAPSVSSFTSAPSSIAAGLPLGWTSSALGNPATLGDVQFDGKVFTIRAAGRGLLQPADEGHFVSAPPGTNRIVAFFIPQIASQFVAFGLACRRGSDAAAPSVALLVMPVHGQRRGWILRLLVRDSSEKVSILSELPLASPVVVRARLLKPVWFRLESDDRRVDAAFSTHGEDWVALGNSSKPEGGRLGLIAASGIPEIATAVRFEIKLS